MPYITAANRAKLEEVKYLQPTCAGDLNYLFSVLIKGYLERKGLNYQAANDAIGALEGAKLELYRRMVAPYEDIKITENGDI